MAKEKKVAVVAIGGNSLIKSKQHQTVEDQYQAAKETAYHLVDMIEAGWEGIFTPYLVPVIGYCEYNCVLCGQSCPTGAIEALTVEMKNGANGEKPVHIGTAFINRSKCLPWACALLSAWMTSPKPRAGGATTGAALTYGKGAAVVG